LDSCLFVRHPRGLHQNSTGDPPRWGRRSRTEAVTSALTPLARGIGAMNQTRRRAGAEVSLSGRIPICSPSRAYFMQIGKAPANGYWARGVSASRSLDSESKGERNLGRSRQTGLARIHLFRDIGIAAAPEHQTGMGDPSTSGSSERRRKLASVHRRRTGGVLGNGPCCPEPSGDRECTEAHGIGSPSGS